MEQFHPPVVIWYLPGLQRSHEVEPAADWNFPCGQSGHMAIPEPLE
jgi:hypothetical protein